MDGWVKLHRELLKKPIWLQSTVKQRVILITLLLMANHEKNKWEWDGEIYICKPGQFVSSLESIKDECGKEISIQNVRTALLRFEKLEFLTNKSTKKGRLITIVNWGVYQISNDEANKQFNNQLTKSQQRPNKDLTTNKNVINKESIIHISMDESYQQFLSDKQSEYEKQLLSMDD